jgi:PAS domain S-box-containing protein
MDSRIIEVNDAYCRMSGYSRKELLGKRLFELEAMETPEKMKNHLQYLTEKGEDCFETKHHRKDGKAIDLEINAQYRPLEGGLLALFLRDITDRNQIEARLQQSQKMEAIGTLAGGIAHDFNNILQPMLGFCELLKDDLPSDSSQQNFVDGILDAAMRAKELVNQILSFSRQAAEEAKPTKLQPIIKEALKLLRSSIPKTIDIEQAIDPECGIVFADPTQIYQIIMNLCSNAYQAMEDGGGTLKVTLKQIHLAENNPAFLEMRPGDYVLLKVSDTGVGIPPTMMSKIFDPYFTTKDKIKGTGLGLSIVQSITKRYNGDIRIYSEPGQGTEIHVYLPIMGKHGDAGSVAEKKIIHGGNERVLLVDDEKPVAEMIHQMMERLGYRVTTRPGALDGLETFRSRPEDFDLVVTDLTMPHMTGIQLAGEIIKIRKDIPIILCTGFSEQTRNDKLKSVGIRAKLAKPVITNVLAEAIRNAIDTEG